MTIANATDTSDLLERLQAWYQAECDGDWEHSWGVTIETLDNPGWSVEIDLSETVLACRPQPPVNIRTSDDDWLIIHITDEKFVGSGDPRKLKEILEAFFAFRHSAVHER